MKTKTTEKTLLWGEGIITLNTSGNRVFTKEVQTIYYICNVPVWKSTKYIDFEERRHDKRN